MVLKEKEKIFSKIRRRLYKHLSLIRGALIGLILILSILVGWFFVPRLVKTLKWSSNQITYFSSLFSKEFFYIDSYKDRVNLLILGAGGTNHVASDLTDTLMVASVDLKDYDMAFLSLPRDLWVNSLKAKINTAFHYGEEKEIGGGLVLAKASVNELIDQPIHYTLFIDFVGFEKMIDLLGGLEIEVERGFEDHYFPIPGKENDECDGDPEHSCRYEKLYFEAGWQHMDGKRALKYVRSRYAEGEEGTDFARARRQQKVLLAVQRKVLNLKFLFSSQRKELFELFKQTVKTDIPKETYLEFAKLAWLTREKTPRAQVLEIDDPETGKEGILYNPPIRRYGQWVLYPKRDDWQKVYDYVDVFFYSSSL